MSIAKADLHALQSFLTAIHPVSEQVLLDYAAAWKPFTASRKTVITAAGDTERYMYFVLEGLQKGYYLVEDKMHVVAFTYPPSFSGIPESFLRQQPSNAWFETITESRFLRISYEAHQAMLAQHRELETLFRIGAELFIVGFMERYFQLMAFPMRERFTAFMQRSPHLLNMVPHKDLASYLRIDATNFSKLLAEIRI